MITRNETTIEQIELFDKIIEKEVIIYNYKTRRDNVGRIAIGYAGENIPVRFNRQESLEREDLHMKMILEKSELYDLKRLVENEADYTEYKRDKETFIESYVVMFGGMVILTIAVLLLPIFFFTGYMVMFYSIGSIGITAITLGGLLAKHYGRKFNKKWINGGKTFS